MNAVVQLQPQGGALSAHTPGHRAVAEIIEHVAIVQQVMRAVMKPDVHYGVIPGTDKPSLLKAGAELLCMVFRIADTYQVEDLSTVDTVRYRVTCIGTHQTTGTMLGTGMGEASSGEEKYKWIKATKTEWDAAPETQRRKKHGYNRKEKREFEILQIRTDPPNLANTVLKMANKRAKLAMVLNVTAASDMFTQDLEDMEDRLREHLADGGDGQPEQPEQPQGPATWPDDAFAKQLPRFRKAIESGKKADEIIAWAETKGALTETQKAAIRAPMQPAAATSASDINPHTGGPTLAAATSEAATQKVTYAQVASRIHAAETQGQLDAAASHIPDIADEAQRAELEALVAGRADELPAF